MSTRLDEETRTEVEASVLRRLLKHLDDNKDVQNIDLMIHAGFCRNCLSKWYVEGAEQQGVDLTIEDAHSAVYGMSYDDWKAEHQTDATPEQLAALKERQG